MTEKYEISAAALKNDMQLAIKKGFLQKDVEQITGISLEELSEPDDMVSMDYYVAFEKGVSALTGNAGIFLELGEMKTGTSQTGVVGHVAASCETLLEAFQQAIRFSSLLSNVNRMELHEEGTLARFIFMREPPVYFTIQGIELAFSRMLTLMKDLWGTGFEPTEVHFQFSPPIYSDLYVKYFKNVLFNQPENQILFTRKLLLQRNPYHQPYVSSIIRKHAEKLLEQKQEAPSLRQQVTAIITRHLPKGELTIELVASELGMSRQTLFRKLKQEADISFKDLMDNVRQQLAKDYIANSTFRLNEIAFLLGFSENSAFHRAFKRWFDKTPGEFRSVKGVV